MLRIARLALAAPALFLLVAAAPRNADYVALPEAKGYVSLYDLSSLTRSDDGFTITSVVDGRIFPHISGPVAYRVRTERFHCPTGRIDLVDFAEYDAVGKRVDADRRDQRSIQTIVAGTADGELANWFCAAGQRAPTPGTTGLGTVTAADHFAAYKVGLPLVRLSDRYGR